MMRLTPVLLLTLTLACFWSGPPALDREHFLPGGLYVDLPSDWVEVLREEHTSFFESEDGDQRVVITHSQSGTIYPPGTLAHSFETESYRMEQVYGEDFVLTETEILDRRIDWEFQAGDCQGHVREIVTAFRLMSIRYVDCSGWDEDFALAVLDTLRWQE